MAYDRDGTCAVVHGLRVRKSTQITHSSTQECGGQGVIGSVCVCVWSVRRQKVHVKNTNNNMFNIYKWISQIDREDLQHEGESTYTYESMGSCPHHPRDPCSQRTESRPARHRGTHLRMQMIYMS